MMCGSKITAIEYQRRGPCSVHGSHVPVCPHRVRDHEQKLVAGHELQLIRNMQAEAHNTSRNVTANSRPIMIPPPGSPR
jgi:hypothetical protein